MPAEIKSTIFKQGDLISGSQGITFSIEKFLGEGSTANVYLATDKTSNQRVAIKFLKTDISEDARKSFWNESMILGSLRQNGIYSVPFVVDQLKQPNNPFIAMEYIDSAQFCPLDDLLEKSLLSEDQALAFMVQALTVFEKLHTKVGRSYTDMQMKNFCWNKEKGNLKIIDWNNVSKPDLLPSEFQPLVQRDISRLSVYLYRVLTGKTALERGEEEQHLETRAGENWSNISVALRQVIIKSLHPNLDQHYPSAAVFLQDITQVQSLWAGNMPELAKELEEIMTSVENKSSSPEGLLKLNRARAIFDLLSRKGFLANNVAQKYKERLSTLDDNFSPRWAVGKRYFENNSYNETIKIWEEEAKSIGNISCFRFIAVARAFKEMAALGDFPSNRIEILKGLKILNEAGHNPEELRKAQDILLKNQPGKNFAGCKPLLAEINAALFIQEARVKEQLNKPEEWKKASENYQKADNLLNLVDYNDRLRSEYGWNKLLEDAKKIEDRIKVRDQSTERYKQIRLALMQDFEEGYITFSETIVTDPANPDLLKLCLEYANYVQRKISPSN